MKVKEIIRQINNADLNIEIIEDKGGASFGFYTKRVIFYQDRLMKATVKSVDAQSIKGKPLLVIRVKF